MRNERDEEPGQEIFEHVDPVCGMSVNPNSSAGKSYYEDQTFYFCSSECKDKFDLQPSDYAKSIVPK